MKRLVLLALLALPLTAQAQPRGPNGGIIAVADGHDVELLPKGTELVVYLYDDDRKPTAGRDGARAVVQEAGRTTTIPLAPQSPNRLVGTLPTPLGSGARVVVSATLADGHKVQARFVNP